MFLRRFILLASLVITAILLFQYAQTRTVVTYDVFCPLHKDLCLITVDGVDEEIWRDRLPEYIPLATEFKNCYLEFCFNDRLQVVGLNPSYHLWSEYDGASG